MASSVASCWPASLRQNLLSIFLNLSLLQARSKGSSASDSLLRVFLEGEKSSIRLLQLPHQTIQLMEKGLLSPHYNGHLLLTMSSYSLVGSGTTARKPSDSGQIVCIPLFDCQQDSSCCVQLVRLVTLVSHSTRGFLGRNP